MCCGGYVVCRFFFFCFTGLTIFSPDFRLVVIVVVVKWRDVVVVASLLWWVGELGSCCGGCGFRRKGVVVWS